MKNLFILCLFSISLFSCGSDSEITPAVGDSAVIVDVRIQEKLSTGEIVEKNREAAIHIWKADGKTFEIKSTADAIKGYAFDNNSNASIMADYSTIGHHFVAKAPPGRYFIYVLLTNQGRGGFSYSHTYFEIKAGEALNIKKVFSHDINNLAFEDWDKNK